MQRALASELGGCTTSGDERDIHLRLFDFLYDELEDTCRCGKEPTEDEFVNHIMEMRSDVDNAVRRRCGTAARIELYRLTHALEAE